VFTSHARRAHSRLEILLADIQSGAPLVQKFHRNPSGHKRTRPQRARLEEPQGSEESDPRALGNNRQLLSVAPNPMPTDELTASRKLRGPRRTRAPFSRLHGGRAKRPGMLTGKYPQDPQRIISTAPPGCCRRSSTRRSLLSSRRRLKGNFHDFGGIPTWGLQWGTEGATDRRQVPGSFGSRI
jgi:hypothetical protein